MKFLKPFAVFVLTAGCFFSVTHVVFADNSAPVLDTSQSPAMASVAQDASVPVGAVGTSVTSLIDGVVPAGGLDNVSDVDGGASLGIAITAADTTNVTYYYSINSGTTWNALGAVSNTAARLLDASPSNRIYGHPNASYSGTVSSAITFRAWDQTSGTNGGVANTASNGGTTAFSTATDTASLTVTAAPTAPDTFIISDTNEFMVSPIWGFTFESSDDPSTFECSLDSGGFAPCVSPYLTPTLALGLHTFEVRATNDSLLVDATPAAASWTVISDYTLESASPLLGATGVSTNTSIVFRFTDTVDSFLRDHFNISSGPCDTSCPTLEAAWSENNTVLTYTKTDGPFKSNTVYTFRLGNDHDGVVDEDVYNGSFTTRKNASVGGRVSGSEKILLPENVKVNVPEFHFLRTLKFGLQGDDVVVLQKFLGITPPASKHFGPLTKATLIKYQKDHGLDGDGIAGPKTFTVIEAEMNKAK